MRYVLLCIFSLYFTNTFFIKVVGANNGVEAIEAYQLAREQNIPFDIILMDCQMPVMYVIDFTYDVIDLFSKIGMGIWQRKKSED